VKDILWIAWAHIVTAVRERVTLFWFLVFPAFLLTILALIFGNVGQEGEISFDITFINQEGNAASSMSFAAAIEQAFESLATPQEESAEPLFTLHTPPPGSNLDDYLDAELTQLRRGHRGAVVVIPPGFDDAVASSLMGSPTSSDTASLRIYMSETSVSSEYASQIVQQVLSEIDRRILTQAGRFDPDHAIATQTEWVGGQGNETPYIDFVLPAIIIMGFFVNGLFGVPGTILFSRDRNVLRRYWVTPFSVPRYLAGFGLGHLALCAIQFVLLYALGVYVFGAHVSFASAESALFLVLAAITFMAFGFLIASLAKTANAGMAVANILNMPLMFLSGMFFPTGGLPAFILAIVYVNPVTYLLEGLRRSVGVQSGTLMAPILTVLVPVCWILLSGTVAAWRLRWDVER
jgi:ABC-2 type transport system permease protein